MAFAVIVIQHAGVKDLGWRDDTIRAPYLIREMMNDDVFMLLRRFKKIVGMAAYRSPPLMERTSSHRQVLCGVLYDAVLFRYFCPHPPPPYLGCPFPPAPLAAISATQIPRAGTPGSPNSLYGAPEAQQHEAVEQAASHCVAVLPAMGACTVMGEGSVPTRKHGEAHHSTSPRRGTETEVDESSEDSFAGALPDASRAALKAKNTKDTANCQCRFSTRPRGACGEEERRGRIVGEDAPSHEDTCSRYGYVAASRQTVVGGTMLLVGILFFSQPILSKLTYQLTQPFPHWRKVQELRRYDIEVVDHDHPQAHSDEEGVGGVLSKRRLGAVRSPNPSSTPSSPTQASTSGKLAAERAQDYEPVDEVEVAAELLIVWPSGGRGHDELLGAGADEEGTRAAGDERGVAKPLRAALTPSPPLEDRGVGGSEAKALDPAFTVGVNDIVAMRKMENPWYWRQDLSRTRNTILAKRGEAAGRFLWFLPLTLLTFKMSLAIAI
ncbi:hypothetical protein C8Q76DRAFT_696769 [Earliella scabrosa]|nr:hypothetical protein C8Q76DRAFT_696769 [Earliella scabrosa]